MNIYLFTLGCRLNQCETESVAYSFEKAGFNILKDKDNADLIIVNSCTVTSKAEQKARRMIRIFSKICPVLVTGCYAQMNEKELKALSPNVVVFSLELKSRLMDLPSFILASCGGHLPESSKDMLGLNMLSLLNEYKKGIDPASPFLYEAKNFSYHSRAYLKIQDGCDNNCGYCRVTVARGPSLSLDWEDVVKRALEIEKAGYKEIMLTGVNLTQYDYAGKGLGGLLEKLLPVLGKDIRLRLSSMEPDHVDDRLLEQLNDYRMQPHFHIPIQSASNKVLERINRKYDKNHLEYIVRRLKVIKDDPFVACDIITGLPGEGEKEFEETYNFIQKEKFSQLHVFPFSPRPNTPLYEAKDRDPEFVRDKRAEILRNFSENLFKEYINRQDGKIIELILEGGKEKGWKGLTGNYLHVKLDKVPEDAKKGDLFKAKLEKNANGIKAIIQE